MNDFLLTLDRVLKRFTTFRLLIVSTRSLGYVMFSFVGNAQEYHVTKTTS